MSDLTPQQKRFVDEYLRDLNATQAAIRAGYSAKTADSQAAQLLRKTKVAEAIADAQKAREHRTTITADRVLRELAIIGFSDVTNYEVDEDGKVTLAENAPKNAMRAVSSIKSKTRWIPQKDGETIKEVDTEIRLWNKNDALKQIGQHLGMFTERVELSGRDGGAIVIQRVHDGVPESAQRAPE